MRGRKVSLPALSQNQDRMLSWNPEAPPAGPYMKTSWSWSSMVQTKLNTVDKWKGKQPWLSTTKPPWGLDSWSICEDFVCECQQFLCVRKFSGSESLSEPVCGTETLWGLGLVCWDLLCRLVPALYPLGTTRQRCLHMTAHTQRWRSLQRSRWHPSAALSGWSLGLWIGEKTWLVPPRNRSIDPKNPQRETANPQWLILMVWLSWRQAAGSPQDNWSQPPWDLALGGQAH